MSFLPTFSKLLAVLVGLIHVYFCYIEMFRWTAPASLLTFGNSLEQAQASALLAANQGLYNFVLGIGLIYASLNDLSERLLLRRFLLAFVIIVGCYGAATVTMKILYVQVIPGLLAFIVTLLAYRRQTAHGSRLTRS